MFALLNTACPPILTTRDAMVRTPVFHVLRLYRRLTGRARVQSEVAGPTVDRPEEAAEKVTETAWSGTLVLPPCSVTAVVLEKGSNAP
jgi:hypothetical protein